MKREARGIPADQFTSIFNNLDDKDASVSRKRGMSKALEAGQCVSQAIFQFLKKYIYECCTWTC
jgi:hypothetical protein